MCKDGFAMGYPASLDFILGSFIESTEASAVPTRQLWHIWMRQDPAQDVFIRSEIDEKCTAQLTVPSSVCNDIFSNCGKSK